MLDIRYVCENLEQVKAALATRSGSYDPTPVYELDLKRRAILKEVEDLKAARNKASDQIAVMKRNKENADELIALMKEEGEKIKALDAQLTEIEAQLKDAILALPNIPSPTIPVGKDDSENQVVRTFLEPTKFDFEPKAHWDLGEALKIFDWQAAAKISGARFTVYKDQGARLERAVMNFMLDTHTANGYTEVFPPFMVNRDSMIGTGQLPKFEDDAYHVSGDNFLIPTAEVVLTNLHAGEVLDADTLPRRYTAFTPCFREEAGSAGRDTRGIIRQHEFDKVEMVKFATPEDSDNQLESMTAEAEYLLQQLGLPYRVISLCTGDLGFSARQTYDVEVWLPSYNGYKEISSCSNCGDFQARRANIKYRDPENFKGSRYLHTLNGSGLPTGRAMAAILENGQQKDGSIVLPKALVPYMDGVEVIEPAGKK